VPRGASLWPAQLRAAPLVAGRRRVPDAVACASARALGDLLSSRELCMRLPGGQRARGLRNLYAVLQWTSSASPDRCAVEGRRLAWAGRGARRRLVLPAAQQGQRPCWPPACMPGGHACRGRAMPGLQRHGGPRRAWLAGPRRV